MYAVYDDWPNIARDAYTKNSNKIDLDPTNHIVFAGMGGSGTIGDFFSAVLSKTNIHTNVVKGYTLPSSTTSNSLIILISVSGNSAEIISVLKSAHDIGCQIVAFSSGGYVEKFCKDNDMLHGKITMIHSPRSSFVGYIYEIIQLLSNIIPISKTAIEESLLELDKTCEIINSKNLTFSNPSLQLAEKVSGIPLIYYPWGLFPSAVRFKNSIQENVKIHVMIEDIIEACHNNIVSWESSSDVFPILLQGDDDNVKTKERWKILKEYFKINDIDYHQIYSVKGSIFSKLINLIYLLDYSSIYLAVKNKIDPSPVKSIDFVKSRLES
ncbi:MAG: SIS domain-containing protein [Nitrosopumilus sp.]|nr:MAG: SIS domain-containing protein [Nitrosopumilus sp.]